MSSVASNITDTLYRNFYKIIYLILLSILLFSMMNTEEKKPVETKSDYRLQLVESGR